MQRGYSFTEILLAVALAAIVGAVAGVNRRAAQEQSETTRAKADLRELAVALQAYNVDWGLLPPDGDDYRPIGSGRSNPMFELNRESDLLPACPAGAAPNNGPNNRVYYFRTYKTWTYLTTPVAYVQAVRVDPFSAFVPYGRQDDNLSVADPQFMLLTSCGPDKTVACADPAGNSPAAVTGLTVPPLGFTGSEALCALNNIYDPTNGAVSWGEIYRFAAIKNREPIARKFGTLLPGDYTP